MFLFALFYGLRSSAVGRTLIRQGSASQVLVSVGCGQLVVLYIFRFQRQETTIYPSCFREGQMSAHYFFREGKCPTPRFREGQLFGGKCPWRQMSYTHIIIIIIIPAPTNYHRLHISRYKYYLYIIIIIIIIILLLLLFIYYYFYLFLFFYFFWLKL